MCISGCPYKKTYFNWSTGKSEKCILCFPRLESGQAPACFHSCVGRIRYLGVLLYDADQIKELASVLDTKLVEAQRNIIQDPFDHGVMEAAKKCGISDAMVDAAQKSPVYKFVKKWRLALPLHPEFRTLPMLFYVPPMLPVLSANRDGRYDIAGNNSGALAPMISSLDQARVPLRFMSNLFSAGNDEEVAAVYRKLMAVRLFKRGETVGDVPLAEVKKALEQGKTTAEEAEAIFRLTALPTFEERFVIPPLAREVAVEMMTDPLEQKQEAGFGIRLPAARRW